MASLPLHQLATLAAVVTAALFLCPSAASDFAGDRAACASELVGLSTCLPYVQGGGSKAPTPDCCSGLKQVLHDKPVCLCVLLRDRDDPSLGIHINATRALSLPSVCSAPANVSECPRALKLSPNSPEAQIFKQNESRSGAASNANSGSTVKGSATGARESSGGRRHYYLGAERWLGVEWLVGLLVLPLLVLAD